MYNKKPIRIAVITCVLFFIIILGVSAYFLIDEAQKTAVIHFIVAPVSANISLNGESFKNLETHNIKPGDYELIISKPDYFENWTGSFTIGEGETKEVYVKLNPLPNTNWYKDHPSDADSIDAINDYKLYQRSDYLVKNYPLITKLPIQVEYFKNNSTYIYYVISYTVDDDNHVTILIQDYTGDNYNPALERIKAEGFNPDDYVIKYQDKTAEITPISSPE